MRRPAAREMNRPPQSGTQDAFEADFLPLYAAAAADVRGPAGPRLAALLVRSPVARPRVELDHALTLALATPWAAPETLVRVVVDYLLLDPALARAAQNPSDTAYLLAAAERLDGNGLFDLLLDVAAVGDPRLVGMMVALRDQFAAVPPTNEVHRRLAAVLALQANRVDYVWPLATDASPVDIAVHGASSAAGPARALVDAMFRAPSESHIGLLETLAGDAAIDRLLPRLRDEPARELQIRHRLERWTSSLGTETTTSPLEARPFPRWIAHPRGPRALPAAVHGHMRQRRFRRPGVLVAGCGTGRELPELIDTYPQAQVTAVDTSLAALAYAARKCEEAHLHGIDFIPGDLLDVPPLGWTFDIVECAGVVRTLPDLHEGCAALARCTTVGSVLRLAVLTEGSCRLVNTLKDAFRAHCPQPSDVGVRRFRADLLDGALGPLPRALLDSPDFCTGAGLMRLLLGEREQSLGALAWAAELEGFGFEFLCVEASDALIDAAGEAGFPSASEWNLREWERFERGHPFVFGATYHLWFVRRDAEAPSS
jgi:SAM-dependent methyltransferase